MVHPILLNEEVVWCTKAGHDSSVAIDATNFIKSIEHCFDKPKYNSFAKYCLNENKTPLFEYISPHNRICLKYTQTSLVLLAMRDNYTGEYLNINF